VLHTPSQHSSNRQALHLQPAMHRPTQPTLIPVVRISCSTPWSTKRGASRWMAQVTLAAARGRAGSRAAGHSRGAEQG